MSPRGPVDDDGRILPEVDGRDALSTHQDAHVRLRSIVPAGA